MKKKLPIGKQNFEEIIKDGFLYVDKTRQVLQLLKGAGLYFMSRPRRFGKSLLMSILENIFKGNKELFKGLYIYESDWEWKPSPVLHFNFASMGYEVTNLKVKLKENLTKLGKNYGMDVPDNSPGGQLDWLVSHISEKHGKTVILIDEYDKPIIDFIDQYEQAKTNRGILKEFYSPLKDLESKGHIRFLFMTGVSKFSRVSIFSDLNNLDDLTTAPKYVSMLGITENELLQYFTEQIRDAAKRLEMDEKKLLQEIKAWYNGYSWDAKNFVYNPFSLLNFLDKKKFDNYWFATGTPTFLVKEIRRREYPAESFRNKKVDPTFFLTFNLQNLDIFSVMFQTGYLTIKNIVPFGSDYIYTLDYPNNEVQQSFEKNLFLEFSHRQQSDLGQIMIELHDALANKKIENFISIIESIFADISYHLFPKKKKGEEAVETNWRHWENHYQSLIYLLLKMAGINTQTEVFTNRGRIDAVIETEKYVYLLEYKMGGAQSAIDQIKKQEYFQKYINHKKEVVLLGIGFDKEKRNVGDWLAVDV